MVGEHALHNGAVILQKNAVLPITLREVQSGFYVYESVRIIQAHPVHLEDHLVRLQLSAKMIGLVHSFSNEQIHDWVYALIAADEIDRATMRIQIYGGANPQLFITTNTILSYPDSYYTDGVKVITYRGERMRPGAKTGNLLLNYMALEAAKKQDAFEALLVADNQQILEGTRSNFFGIKEGTLFTAPDEKVLLGVTRDRVIKAAKVIGLKVVYEAPSLEAVHTGEFDELFISATSMAAMPISRVDGIAIGSFFDKTLAISKLVRDWELED